MTNRRKLGTIVNYLRKAKGFLRKHLRGISSVALPEISEYPLREFIFKPQTKKVVEDILGNSQVLFSPNPYTEPIPIDVSSYEKSISNTVVDNIYPSLDNPIEIGKSLVGLLLKGAGVYLWNKGKKKEAILSYGLGIGEDISGIIDDLLKYYALKNLSSFQDIFVKDPNNIVKEVSDYFIKTANQNSLYYRITGTLNWLSQHISKAIDYLANNTLTSMVIVMSLIIMGVYILKRRKDNIPTR